MRVFLDFEASSLEDASYPIEVGWAFEDGLTESHLIRPAPGWTDWAPDAEAIHGIPREELVRVGSPHDVVARRMVEALAGHDLYATAPSWDGKWLSVLLRAAGLPRHALRLRRAEEAHLQAAREVLSAAGAPEPLGDAAAQLVARARERAAPGPAPHRALADAERELRVWLAVRQMDPNA